MGYGRFEAVAAPRFASGQRATIYLEVENFSQKQVGTSFETRLAGEYRILKPSGEQVLARQLPVDRQRTMSSRRDYFAAYRIVMPELPEGEYQFQILLRDDHAGRTGSATVPFELLPQQVEIYPSVPFGERWSNA